MKRIVFILIVLGLVSCKQEKEIALENKTGTYSGIFQHGDFSTKISFAIEKDSTKFNVFFTSLEQNASGIPIQGVEQFGDSINFKLQSDFYTYSFKNKWIANNRKLQGELKVDSVAVTYILEKELGNRTQTPFSEEVNFESDGLQIKGTIWHPKKQTGKALVFLTSSGNSDRSSSRAEAILFSEMGFTVFHYDKRGTGATKGNWQSSTMNDLLQDDINAIHFFSSKTGIALDHIGIKGSSQGGVKVPYILNTLDQLKYGISVSCPGVSLYESDLNYWKNRNSEVLGDDLEEAANLQRMVFEFIAGIQSKSTLQDAIENHKSTSWFEYIWVPNLQEVQTDTKLLFSPIPYFEKTVQPVLIIQGTLDEIIPPNSVNLILQALNKAKNDRFKTVLLGGANHSMYQVGSSDFPYWSKLHPDYLSTINSWIGTLSND